MGNYSKNPQTALQEAVQKGYSRVRFQQGKPILDRELNLAADLAAPNRLLQQYVGSGVPDGSDGFNIVNVNPVTQDFTIKAGRCIVNGFEAALANDTTYKNQPNKGNLRPFPQGQSFIYLRVFTVEVNETQDTDLRNSTDIGFETALRERVDWEVLILTAPTQSAPDHFFLGTLTFTGGGGPPPEETSALRTSPTRAAARAAKRPTAARAADEPSITIEIPGDPTASFTDSRVTGLKLTRVRADLDLLLNPLRTGVKDNLVGTTTLKDNSVTPAKLQSGAVGSAALAAQSVKVVNLSGTIVSDLQTTVNPNTSSNIVIASAGNVGVNPWFLVSVWGTGTFTWVEKIANNERMIFVTNATGSSVSVNVKTLKLNP